MAGIVVDSIDLSSVDRIVVRNEGQDEMKRTYAGLVLMVCCLVAGCSTTGGIKADVFPAGQEALCMQQLAIAKAGIERCGTPLKRVDNITVSLRKGEQKIDGMWCWQLTPGYWIGGLTEWGHQITVGCNPSTLGEVSPGVLLHEMGHYWLITNKGINSHDPKYDSVFHWAGLPMAKKPAAKTHAWKDPGIADRVVDTPTDLKGAVK